MPRGRAVLKPDEVEGDELSFGFHIEELEDDRVAYTQASEVKVTRADGSVEVKPPYDPAEYDQIVRKNGNK